jgi:hypothetical protein
MGIVWSWSESCVVNEFEMSPWPEHAARIRYLTAPLVRFPIGSRILQACALPAANAITN